jgi:hypothetical protein
MAAVKGGRRELVRRQGGRGGEREVVGRRVSKIFDR